jgi:hypothetical protein
MAHLALKLFIATLIFASLFFGCKARTSENALQGSVELSAAPPQVLYHFGSYRDFKRYMAKKAPPTVQEWLLIPSVGPTYEVSRRGLYGAQHPAYAERYGAEFLSKGFENGPWLVKILMNPNCLNAGNQQVIPDTRWPESGFWIVRSRECIVDIESHPTEVLRAFATVPELWNEKPFISEKSRREDDKEHSYKILTAVLVTALVLADSVADQDFLDMLAIAKISDVEPTRNLITALLRVAQHCSKQSAWANFRRGLGAVVSNGGRSLDNSDIPKLGQLCINATEVLAEAEQGAAELAPDAGSPGPDPRNPAGAANPTLENSTGTPKIQLHNCQQHRAANTCRGDKTGYCTWVHYKSIEWCFDRRSPCSQFAYDGRACNNDTDGRCRFGPYKSINWCHDLSGDCNSLAYDKESCNRATNNRCVYTAYKSINWCFSRDAPCGEFSADKVVCDSMTNDRCAFGRYKSINWCYDRDAACHEILDQAVCESRAKKSCRWAGHYCAPN